MSDFPFLIYSRLEWVAVRSLPLSLLKHCSIGLLFFCFVLMLPPAISADEPVFCDSEGAITLSSQSDVDNFQQNYGPSRDTMMYGIRIDGGNDFQNWRISNLDGLSGLKSIQGDLDIYGNYFLSDVTGLSDLERIEGALKLERNACHSRVQRLEISLPKLSYAFSIELVSSGPDFKLGSFSADALASLPGDLRIGAQSLDALSL